MSNKLLWSIVANRILLASDSLLEEELNKSKDEFRQLLQKYKPRGTGETGTKILDRIGSLLNLTNMQSEEVLFSYLTHGFRGTASSSEEIFKDQRMLGPFLIEVYHFYKSERQYLLQSLKCILQGSLGECPKKDIFSRFLASTYTSKPLKDILFDQLSSLMEESIPSGDLENQALRQEHQSSWAWYTLREIAETLSLLNLTLQRETWSGKDFLKLLQISQKSGFGKRLSLRHLFDARCEPLVDTIGQLTYCVLLQMLSLRPLLNSMSSLDHAILKDSAIVTQAEVILSGMGSQKEHGPVLLGWLIMHSLGPLGDEAIGKYKRLGQKAVEQRVLATLNQAVRNPDIQDTVNPIVYELFLTLSSKIEPASLGTVEDLHSICEKILASKKIAEEFWSDGLETGLGQIVTETILKYPAVPKPFLDIINSLVSASETSCAKVVDILNEFPGVANFLDEIPPSHIRSAGPGAYILCVNKEMYGHLKGGIVLPVGVESQIVGKHFGREVVQWDATLPAWKLFELQTEDLLFQLQQGMASVQLESINTVKSIITLVAEVLKFSPESYSSLETLSELILTVLDRFSLLPSVPNDLLAACLRLVSALLNQPEAREGVWHHLKQSRLSPHFLGLVEDPLEMVIQTEMNSALVGQILAGQECVTGTYPLTLAFLEFVLASVKLEDSVPEILLPSIVFVLREIFPTRLRWRFDDLLERNRVTDLCLEIFHASLNSDNVTAKTVTAASLLHGPAGYSLLELIAIGDKAIQGAFESDSSFGSGAGAHVTSHVCKSLTLLNKLFVIRADLKLNEKISDPTLAEKLLRTQPSGQGQPHLALTVAHYLYNRHFAQIPISAIELLTFMGSDFGLSLLACFGADEEAVREVMLRRLCYGTDDIRLKEAILKFLTACVSHQPGLLQVFIDPSDITKKKENTEDSSVLKVVLANLKELKSPTPISVSMFTASVSFCCALWAAGCNPAIAAIKHSKTFWSDVCHPLFAAKPNFGSMTLVLRLLCLDLFGCTWKPDKELEEVLRKLVAPANLNRISKFILKLAIEFRSTDDLDLTTIETSKTPTDFSELHLLSSFRDFIVILTNPRSPVQVAEGTIKSVIEDTLESLRVCAEKKKPETIQTALADLLVVLFSKCKRKEDFTSCSEDVADLLAEYSSSFMNLKPRLQINLLASALHIAASSEGPAIQRLLPSVLSLFQSYVQRIPAYLQAEIPNLSYQRVLLLVLTLLRVLIVKLEQDDASLTMIEQADVTLNLQAVARMSLQVERGVEVCEASLASLMVLAEIPRFSSQLLNSDLGTTLWLPASTLPVSEATKEAGQWTSNWNRVWKLLIGLCTILLHTLNHQAVDEGLSLVGLSLERFANYLLEGPDTIDCQKLDLSVTVLGFLFQLSKYKKEWRLKHRYSWEKIMPVIYKAIYRSVALLLRPSLLAALLDNRKFAKSNIAKRPALAFEVDLHPISLSNLHRESISEESPKAPAKEVAARPVSDFMKTPLFMETQKRLLDLLSRGIAVLSRLSPTLETVLVQVNYVPSRDEILLNTNLSTPALEDRDMEKISCGTLVAVATVCLRLLKDEMEVASHTLYATLQLLLSQSKLMSDVGDISGEDLQSFKRELGGELGLIDESIRRLTQRRTVVVIQESDKKILSLLTNISKKLL